MPLPPSSPTFDRSLLPAGLRRRGLLFIFAATFFELTGLFMFFPLVTFLLKAQGLGDTAVGLVSASNWVGLALAAPFASRWVARMGLRGALLAGGAVPLAVLVGISLTRSAMLWAGLLLVGGVAASLRWIVAETLVAELAPDARRGRIVGLFSTMIGGCIVAGPALLAWMGTEGAAGERAQWCAVVLAALGLVLCLGVPALPATSDRAGGAPARLGAQGIVQAWRAAPAVMVAGAVGGFFEAGVAGVLPLYGLSAGFGAATAALLVAASGLGGTLSNLPMGELADRWSVRRVSLGCAALNLGAALALPWAAGRPALAAALAFTWGSAGSALYTLAMVEIGHRETGVRLVNATAVLVLAYTAGGALAPALGGLALDAAPGWGLAALLVAVAGGGLLALARQGWESARRVPR